MRRDQRWRIHLADRHDRAHHVAPTKPSAQCEANDLPIPPHLSATSEKRREEFIENLRARSAAKFKALERQIRDAVRSVYEQAYCAASWQPEVVALATPLVLPDKPIYVINISLSTRKPISDVATQLCVPLLKLRDKIAESVAARREEEN